MNSPKVVSALAATAMLIAGTTAMATGDSSSATTAAAKVKVPNLHCHRLDSAEDIVRSKGLRVVERGGGTFGIIVKSSWVVSSQRPSAGAKVSRGTKVYLYADRSC
jgi:beta-lactam-binding protein with PASTA domain